MSAECEVIGALLVALVNDEGPDLVVDLYGGYEPRLGTLRYECSDTAERDDYRRVFTRWADEDISVVLIHDPHGITVTESRRLSAERASPSPLHRCLARLGLGAAPPHRTPRGRYEP